MNMSWMQNEAVGSPVRVFYDDPSATSVLGRAVAEWIAFRAAGRPLLVVCVGTDRSTGDALGPIVGTRLKEEMPPGTAAVFGTLDEPVHAVNLPHTVESIRRMQPAPFVIAVDACLGQAGHVGQISVNPGPLKPGAGVHKQLPPLGDIHITGVVNVGGYMEYFVLQNTRLHLVFRMATCIAQGIAAGIAQGLSHPPSPGAGELRIRIGRRDAEHRFSERS